MTVRGWVPGCPAAGRLGSAAAALGVVLAALLAGLPGVASAARVQQELSFTASDGVQLHAVIGGEGDLRPRPLIVEFSPYAPACCGNSFGPDYNHVQVHARGTGRSAGTWGAVGPRDQQDVSEFLRWACRQPWSSGHIGLYGFSASAIAVYNSMHLPLDCVDAAALMAGTSDLYRDLLYPGGITNLVPATTVGLTVGCLLLGSGPQRTLEGHLLDSLRSGVGLLGTFVEVLGRPTLDDFWAARTQREGPNRFPVLADTGFYDPESRGPFESFRRLRRTNPGSHLLVLGAHDGFPAGTGGPFPEYRRWFDRHLLGRRNGIDREPAVRLWLGHGSREALLAGRFTRVDAEAWPVPGTRWRRLYLDPGRAGGAPSLDDGTLRAAPAPRTSTQSHPAVASLATETDPHTTSVLGPSTAMLPGLTDLSLTAPTSLSYTTAPFPQALDVAGPAALDLFVSTTTPDATLYAVVADVAPDGRAFPVGVGRLRTSFPGIDRARSLIDADGEVVQPYGVYSAADPATPGRVREYHVEFWPLGNRFAAGHRLRLHLTGSSSFMLPGAPAVNTVSLGGATPSRLLLPVLPPASAAVRVLPEACLSRRRFTIHLRVPRGQRLAAATVTVGGQRVRVLRGRRWRAVVDLRGRASPRRVVVRVSGRTRSGHRVRDTRTYRPCRPGAAR